ncbi:hypothetical protein H206_06155 [Candidatus Electrothrix aarhusensis]|uniref:Uncharacterized protein n=1 Tax=Candidatus Electrothrix aarhusensis TaxID=1859131 RepID=A0A444J360_9BACT|nr:hypothetical protein H206_06155 [Candidatus Electrothrix aarhusensis]
MNNIRKIGEELWENATQQPCRLIYRKQCNG